MARLQVMLPGCVVLLFSVGLSSADIETEESFHHELKWAHNKGNHVLKWAHHEEKAVIHEIRKLDPKSEGTGCDCTQKTYDCGCCVYMDIPDIGLDDTGCLNFTYLPHDYGISVTFSIDGRVWYNYTVSARNPPPLCFGIPHLKEAASLCIDFYNLDISNSTFSGCTKIEAELAHVKLVDIHLGCFSLPLYNKIKYSFLMEPKAFEAFELLQKRFVDELSMLRQKKMLK